MITIVLKHGLCDGELISRMPAQTLTHWRHPGGRNLRYQDSGATDPVTGYSIFVYKPLRHRRAG
jgi:hypothetical protein